MDHDEAEREAMRQHYAAPASPNPWQPGTPDPLAAGLLKSAREARQK
jgi:hypothetical protein